MLHGVVIVPVTDIRALADSKSERLSQALFGTPLEIHETRKDFAKIKLLDGYLGWSRLAHLDQVGFAAWRDYISRPKHMIKSEMVVIRGERYGLPETMRLYFGTELAVFTQKGNAYFELPNGVHLPVNKSHLIFREKKKTHAPSIKAVLSTARRFLGTPYLWGGITPLGFDCSGLIQSAFKFHGIALPRDSKEQRLVGFEIAREELRPGDLLFFPGHVVLSTGGLNILHASTSRGMVVIESLDPKAQNYRKDLDSSFEFARRLAL